MGFKVDILVQTITSTHAQQAPSQLIVTVDDHRPMGQADKTRWISELDACTIIILFERNDANFTTCS